VPIWGAPPLSSQERQVLEHDYRYGATRLVRQRSHIVLLSGQLETQAEIARVVGCSLDTIQRTLKLYGQRGRSALRGRFRLRPSGRRRNLDWLKALAEAMEQGPQACGVKRPTWTAPLLAQYLTEQTGVQVGERSVRRGLASLDYVCRRSTWVLRHKAEAEPDYRPKWKGSKRS
jgi:transposase